MWLAHKILLNSNQNTKKHTLIILKRIKSTIYNENKKNTTKNTKSSQNKKPQKRLQQKNKEFN